MVQGTGPRIGLVALAWGPVVGAVGPGVCPRTGGQCRRQGDRALALAGAGAPGPGFQSLLKVQNVQKFQTVLALLKFHSSLTLPATSMFLA